MHRAVMRKVYRSLGAEKFDELVEDFVRLFPHQVVAGGIQRNHGRIRNRPGEVPSRAGRGHRIARAEQEQRGAFHLRGALESRLVSVAGGEVGVQHPGFCRCISRRFPPITQNPGPGLLG